MPQLPQIDSVKAPDKIVAQATRATLPVAQHPVHPRGGAAGVVRARRRDVGRGQRPRLLVHEPAGGRRVGNRVHGAGLEVRLPPPVGLHHAVPHRQRGAHPLAPYRGWEPTRAWARSRGSSWAYRSSRASSPRSRSSCWTPASWRYGGRLDDPREYVKALGLMLVPFACIMTQPDLGTGLVYLCIGAVALVVGGARPKYLPITLAAFVAAVIAVFVVDQIIYNSTGEYKLLKQYQRNRLLVFLDPDIDPTGESYNLKQAQIAIGSGGLFGKGLFQERSIRWASCPRLPPTSSSACWPRNWGFRCNGAAGLVCRPGFDKLSHCRRFERSVRHDHRHVRRRHVVVPDS